MRQLDSPDTSHRDELVLVVLKARPTHYGYNYYGYTYYGSCSSSSRRALLTLTCCFLLNYNYAHPTY